MRVGVEPRAFQGRNLPIDSNVVHSLLMPLLILQPIPRGRLPIITQSVDGFFFFFYLDRSRRELSVSNLVVAVTPPISDHGLHRSMNMWSGSVVQLVTSLYMPSNSNSTLQGVVSVVSEGSGTESSA